MPRQNQDHGSYVIGVTRAAPLNKGGTGASNSEEAVANLRAISRQRIDVDEGIAAIGNNGKLLPEYFRHMKIFVGPRIAGPSIIYRGCSARFRISNYCSEFRSSISFAGYTNEEVGFVEKGNYFSVTLPVDFPQEQLQLVVMYDGMARDIFIPVDDPSIDQPYIMNKTDVAYKGYIVLEASVPIFRGESSFDEYVSSAHDPLLLNTKAVTPDGDLLEYTTYTSSTNILIEQPCAVVRVSGKLKSPDGYAYVEYDNVRYPLTEIANEHVIVPEVSLALKIVVSPGESIDVAQVRPYKGNVTASSALKVEAVIEYADNPQGPHEQYGQPIPVTNSLNFPLPGIPYGEKYIRIKYVYTAGETVLESWYTEMVKFTIVNNDDVDISIMHAPLPDKIAGFGKSVCVQDANGYEDIFVGGNQVGGENCIIWHREYGNGRVEYKDTIYPPVEVTRNASEGFGLSVVGSENGRFVFVAAPTATFSDAPGVSGAVYIYEKVGFENEIGGRVVYRGRLTDPDLVLTGFGSLIAEAKGRLVIGSMSSSSVTPKMYVYDINEPNFYESPNVIGSTRVGEVGMMTFSSISMPVNIEMSGNHLPIIFGGRRKNAQTTLTSPSIFIGSLNVTTGAIEIKGSYENGAATGLDSKGFMSTVVAVHDGASVDNHYGGLVFTLNPVSREISNFGWIFAADGSTAQVEETNIGIELLTIPGEGQLDGGLGVYKNRSAFLVGDTNEPVTIDTVNDSTTYQNAGAVIVASRTLATGPN